MVCVRYLVLADLCKTSKKAQAKDLVPSYSDNVGFYDTAQHKRMYVMPDNHQQNPGHISLMRLLLCYKALPFQFLCYTFWVSPCIPLHTMPTKKSRSKTIKFVLYKDPDLCVFLLRFLSLLSREGLQRNEIVLPLFSVDICTFLSYFHVSRFQVPFNHCKLQDGITFDLVF